MKALKVTRRPKPTSPPNEHSESKKRFFNSQSQVIYSISMEIRFALLQRAEVVFDLEFYAFYCSNLQKMHTYTHTNKFSVTDLESSPHLLELLADA